MKRMLTYLFLSATFFGSSQITTVYLEHNNVSTMLHSNGALGFDPLASEHAYEVPKGSGRHALYMLSPIFTTEVDAGQLIGNFSDYAPNSGGFSGPIVNDYDDPWYGQHSFFFHMHDSVINNHLSNWTNSGYVPSQKMANWPAYGNSALNSSPYLAPFYDVNNDNVYTPEDGDYPFHMGEESFSSVYNYDSIINPNIFNSETRPIEVNYHAYQVNSNDLKNVTFITHRVTNKSNETLVNFQWGLFADFDLGNATDDFIGTNVDKNLLYVYNSTDSDLSGGGLIGYGDNPPAVGVVSLNEDIYATNLVTFGGTHSVGSLANLRYNMTGRKANGQMNTNNLGDPTFFIFDGNPNDSGSESEYQLGNPSQDRRGTLSTSPIDLAPGETKCYHFAIVFADSETSHLESVSELFDVADIAQAYYDNSVNYDCSMVLSSDISSVEDHESVDVHLFPNPTNGSLYLNASERIKSVKIYSMDGKAFTPNLQESQSHQYAIDMSGFSGGVYTVQVLFDNDKVVNRKIVMK